MKLLKEYPFWLAVTFAIPPCLEGLSVGMFALVISPLVVFLIASNIRSQKIKFWIGRILRAAGLGCMFYCLIISPYFDLIRATYGFAWSRYLYDVDQNAALYATLCALASASFLKTKPNFWIATCFLIFLFYLIWGLPHARCR